MEQQLQHILQVIQFTLSSKIQKLTTVLQQHLLIQLQLSAQLKLIYQLMMLVTLQMEISSSLVSDLVVKKRSCRLLAIQSFNLVFLVHYL